MDVYLHLARGSPSGYLHSVYKLSLDAVAYVHSFVRSG